MELDLAATLLDSTREVCWTAMQLPVEAGGCAPGGEAHEVAVAFDFAGDHQGRLALSMGPQTAERVAALLTGRDVSRDGSACTDALAELCSMICGRILAHLGGTHGAVWLGRLDPGHGQADPNDGGRTAVTLCTELGTMGVSLRLGARGGVEHAAVAGVTR